MTTLVCCAIDGCRVTGKPAFGRSVFICTKHMGAASERALNAYTVAAARLKAAQAREDKGGRSAIHARAAEQTNWGRLIGEVRAKHPLKPSVEL